MARKPTTRPTVKAAAAKAMAADVAEIVAMRVSRGKDGGIDMEASTGYDITGGDRSFKSRTTAFDGADRQLDYSNRRKLVSIGREMDRNSLLSAMLDRWTDGTVGNSLNFRPVSGDDGWNKAAYDLTRERMKRCDHRGFFDAASLTRTMLRSIGTDGEQLWAMTADGLIQVIETHQIGTPRDKITARTINDGVELSPDGRPLGYWVSDEVYGGYIPRSTQAEFVSAADAIMPAYRKRASQTHGVPLVAAAMKLYERVDGYIDNESLAAEIDACLTFFIRKRVDTAASVPQYGRRESTNAGESAKVLRKVEPGMISRLAADEEVDQFGAKRPGNQFTPFVEMGLTMVGATIGVPLPLALLDFKRLNYSNARTMLLQMWQTWQIWHRCVVVPAWQWAYQRWILQEIARSSVLRARDDAFAVKWLPRRWPWVDPLREVQALHDEIALGIGTLTDHLELCGYTLDEYLAERSAELKAYAAAGVPTTSTIATGQAVIPPADGESGRPGRDQTDLDEVDQEVVEQ